MLPTHDGASPKRPVPYRWLAVIAVFVAATFIAAYFGIVRPAMSHGSSSARPAVTAPVRPHSAKPTPPSVGPAATTDAFTKCVGIAAGSNTANVPFSATEREIRLALTDHCWYRFDFEMRYEMPTELPQTAYWMPAEPVFNSQQLAILSFIQKLDRGRPMADQLHVIGIPDNVPGWANPKLGPKCTGAVLCAPDAAHVDDYGQFGGDVAFALHQVTDNVAIEPGNEVNSEFSFEPTPSPTLYVAMLKAITKYVNLLPKYAKFVHTPTQVIFSGLSPAQNPGISPVTNRVYSFIDPVSFVSQAYAAGAKPYFTAMGMHVGMNGLSQVMSIHQVMLGYGDGAKPVVLTELDIVTDPTHVAAGTVDYVHSVKSLWLSLSWLKSILVYAPPADGADNSLFKTNMQPKPAMLVTATG